jgi:hypothetical protein
LAVLLIACQEVFMHWEISEKLSAKESVVVRRLHRGGRFYLFLREVRHLLFDEEFQAQLARAYGKARGTAPIPPALLAMVTLLQAYDQVSDHDAVEAAVMDRRWQLVLGCMDCEKAPFSQGVLVAFRERMVKYDLDKLLLDRTIQIARETGKFGWKNLKVALDSSPLLGAGRVEDTWNLIARAMSVVVDCAAAAFGIERQGVLKSAGLTLLSGPSLKAALDIDWDDPGQQAEALQRLLAEVESLRSFVAQKSSGRDLDAKLEKALVLLARVLEQDLEPDPSGSGHSRIRKGTAQDRLPSLGDPEMRHGRKSRSKRFNGYKRHVTTILGTRLIASALVLPANAPEHEALPTLLKDAAHLGELEELKIDRGYLANPQVLDLFNDGRVITCKPWPQRNRGRFTKEQFAIDLEARTVTCPAGFTAEITGPDAKFGRTECRKCNLKPQCTLAPARSISIHPHEQLHLHLRDRRKTGAGKAALRERVAVEHSLASVSGVQGNRARYKGARKNTLDVRRVAAVLNLQTMQRASREAQRPVA